MEKINSRICVIGGGSAGIGAALAASRLGVDTVLVEKNSRLGGTSVNSGVNCWEPVAGATGIPFEIYRELKKIPDAVGIYSNNRHFVSPEHNIPPFPGGESIIDTHKTYADTLLRSGTNGLAKDFEKCREQLHGVIFEPDSFDQVVKTLIGRTGLCQVLTGKSYSRVDLEDDGEIHSIVLDDGTVIESQLWIDCCGELTRDAGANIMEGEESRTEFDEPSAPETPVRRYNAVSLIFRCSPVEKPEIQPLPETIPEKIWWAETFPALCCTHYPNGDRNCNMLPTMIGVEYKKLGKLEAYEECKRRIWCFWHYLQLNFPEFQHFKLSEIFPEAGVRETFRVRCEYILREQDLVAGISGQEHHDFIAISDHMMDSHGAPGKVAGELKEPYGIPYRCLIPEGFERLLVAGKIAGFSSIASSSCRLSRTMIQLGQAAGTAAALASHSNRCFIDIPIEILQDTLRRQYVQLTWPVPNEIREYLMKSD